MTTLRLSTFLLLAAAALLLLATTTRGQVYHYSNGWHPGKRGGVGSLLGGTGQREEGCQFEVRVFTLINKFVTEELARLDRSCSNANTVNNLKMLLESNL